MKKVFSTFYLFLLCLVSGQSTDSILTYSQHFDLALDHFSKGRYQLAENEFKNILIEKRNFNDPVSHFMLAKTQFKQNKETVCERTCNSYINKYPNRFDILYWYLINLGSWAEVYGIFAAAKEGVADQMKHHAQRIIEMDPTYEDGGGYFILGVVHYKSPYIPFILSWPDNDDAVQWLEKSVATGKAKPVQVVYLGQALYKSGEKERALSLLDKIAKMMPSKDDPLGDWEQIKKARTLLKEYE